MRQLTRKSEVCKGDPRKPSLSDFRGAIASLEKAQTIRRRLLEANPTDAENRRLLAENLRLLGARRRLPALHAAPPRQGAQAGHWRLVETQGALGENLIAQKRYGEAEPLLVALYEAWKKPEIAARFNLP
ncbi:MAG: hypothetical protein H0X14_02955 [Acidobacteria bacterium]|nr:hypothetical protein [Acidobacteriota bacterium]